MRQKVLVSRCLLGHRVRYDGGASGPYGQLPCARKLRVACLRRVHRQKFPVGKGSMCLTAKHR